jgi:hypothetical protein
VQDDSLPDEGHRVGRGAVGSGEIFQNAGEPLRLEVGELAGIRLTPARMRPAVLITGDASVPALQLDEEQTRFGEDQDVDLVEPAVAVGKADVRPCSSDAIVGEELAHARERCGLERLRRIAHDPPQR